jgi:hypothetical protein
MKVFWKRKREKLKQKFKSIKNKDLNYTEGNENKMLENLGEKLGKTEEELLKMIIEC